jgi:hypothetical protein
MISKPKNDLKEKITMSKWVAIFSLSLIAPYLLICAFSIILISTKAAPYSLAISIPISIWLYKKLLSKYS